MFEIIEDCSPYYIRFRHTGIEEFIKLAKEKLQTVSFDNPEAPVFIRKLANESGMELLNLLPYKDAFKFQEQRVAYIVSTPRSRNHIHIDGASLSFNYGIDIPDQHCVTRWYDLKTVETTYISRPNLPFDRRSVSADQFPKNPIPWLKSFTQQEGECVLFNSDIYHDVDNSKSDKHRTILTFRLTPPGEIRFGDAKRILFGK
jgi:hypothetical protein